MIGRLLPGLKHTKREEIKDLVFELNGRYPGLKDRVFGAMQRYPLARWELRRDPGQREPSQAQNRERQVDAE